MPDVFFSFFLDKTNLKKVVALTKLKHLSVIFAISFASIDPDRNIIVSFIKTYIEIIVLFIPQKVSKKLFSSNQCLFQQCASVRAEPQLNWKGNKAIKQNFFTNCSPAAHQGV